MFCGYFGGLERCVYTKLSDRLEHLTYDIIMEVVDAPSHLSVRLCRYYEYTHSNTLYDHYVFCAL